MKPKTLSISEMAKNIGTVFQNPEYQIFMPTVKEDIEFGCRNMGFNEEDIVSNRNRASFDLGLNGLLDRETSELSAGEKQRLAIAGIYAVGPNIIIFDEPSTNLDAQGKSAFREILKALKDKSYTIILIEHDRDTFEDLATCKYFMEEGSLKTISSIEHKFPHGKFVYEDHNGHDVIIEAQDISYGYTSKLPLFKDLNLTIRKQEVVSFLGENGSGKTTFFKLLMGILSPQKGFIKIGGRYSAQ